MENNQQHLDALKDIRQLMKQSNKFLSLSGLSGIFVGVYALIGAYFGRKVILDYVFNDNQSEAGYNQLLFECIIICALVLLVSMLTALIFSARKAKKSGQSIFNHTGLRLAINMFIPLGTGGLFCLAMLYHGHNMVLLVSPAMLIFYGLSLVNASKYTLHDIRYLGCMQIALGLAASFYLGYGLLFWAFGFGVLHIIYGTYMWFKYERK